MSIDLFLRPGEPVDEDLRLVVAGLSAIEAVPVIGEASLPVATVSVGVQVGPGTAGASVVVPAVSPEVAGTGVAALAVAVHLPVATVSASSQIGPAPVALWVVIPWALRPVGGPFGADTGCSEQGWQVDLTCAADRWEIELVEAWSAGAELDDAVWAAAAEPRTTTADTAETGWSATVPANQWEACRR